MMNDELEAVADTKDWNTKSEQGGVSGGSVGVVYGAWPTRENEAFGLRSANAIERSGAGQHDGEDVELADAACNELGVLRAKVQDDDGRGIHTVSLNGAVNRLAAGERAGCRKDKKDGEELERVAGLGVIDGCEQSATKQAKQ